MKDKSENTMKNLERAQRDAKTNTKAMKKSYSVGKEVLTLGGVTKLQDIPPGADYAMMQRDVGDMRYWTDGSDPTDSEGFFRTDKEAFDVLGRTDLTNFKAIDVGGSKGNVMVMYFKIK